MKAPTMNNKFDTRRGIVIGLVLPTLLAAGAAVARDDAGVAGGFLRYGSSARSLAVGNAVAGVVDDVATSYWNPAGLAQLRTMEVSGMGATMFNDTRYTYFALGLPTEQWGTFSLNGMFTTSGEFERATWDADLSETFSEKESVVGLGWAGSMDRVAYGINLKSVSQNIGGASGSAMGVDAGVYYRPHRLMSLGASVQNLVSPRITLLDDEEELVRSMRAGMALRFFHSRLLLTGDLVKTRYMDSSIRAGLEAWPVDQLAVRGGWDAEREHMSVGAGFRLNSWQFDYAYVSTDLGAQNVLSATMRFGVPFGVKMSRDKALFSPSGEDREVRFAIETAVRGDIDSWQVEIKDESGEVVRTLAGNGPPPDGVSWAGDDEEGRLVDDGNYEARVEILDNMGQEWQYKTSVEVLGFKDRTRVPIRVEISGSTSATQGGSER